MQNGIPLCNGFNYLEDVKNDINDCVNESDSDCFMFKTPHKKKINYNNHRPSNVINKYSENELHIPKKQVKHVPGANNYSGATKDGEKICIIGDSIIQRIKIKDINKQLGNGMVFKKVYPGGTAEEIAWMHRRF